MIPARHDFVLYKGSTFDVGIKMKDEFGGYADFAKYATAHLHVRPGWEQTPDAPKTLTPLLSMSLENNRIRKSEDEITLTLHLTAMETAELAFREGVYDLELGYVTDDGEHWVDKLLCGSFTILTEMTR